MDNRFAFTKYKKTTAIVTRWVGYFLKRKRLKGNRTFYREVHAPKRKVEEGSGEPASKKAKTDAPETSVVKKASSICNVRCIVTVQSQ